MYNEPAGVSMARLLFVALFAACQSWATSVPDESVLPQWSETLAAVLASRNTGFENVPLRQGAAVL
jgi:hypothetical protein